MHMENGPKGEVEDSHYPGEFQTTLANASVSTSQVYFYRCTCYNQDARVDMMGPITINRSVSGGGGNWTYSISKSGVSNQMALP